MQSLQQAGIDRAGDYDDDDDDDSDDFWPCCNSYHTYHHSISNIM